jgi:hypothetical protein
MKRRIALFTVILAISLLVGELNIDIAEANFYPIPSIYIRGYNPTYPNGNNYTFTVEVHISMDAPAIVSINYSLDGESNITSTDLEYTTWFKSDLPNNHQIYSITINLHNLKVGNHTINAYATDLKGKGLTANWFFAVGIIPNSATPTPTDSQSMPTINTGPTLLADLNQPIVYILAIVITLVAVASISLFYFKRRNTHEKN